MNTVLFGHPAVEPAAYARGLADQLWRKPVDLTAGFDPASLAACLTRDGQVIAMDAKTLTNPVIQAMLTGTESPRLVYLQCRHDALARRCGDAAEALAFSENCDPICQRLARHVFDVSELTVDNGLRYLIRQCM